MSTTLVWIIVALAWAVGAIVAYPIISKENKKNEDDLPTWQLVWFALVWPCTLILAGIHWLHNKE